ncbi:MAG: DNA adenine methylase [Deltaproteobacteria bacterium]|nr:DNA adenine methylase [Deltaproteobacteria bacterium]
MLAKNLPQTSAPARRRRSSRAVPRPFLKWVGGKTQLLSTFESFMPDTWGRYFEPFVGGGAMYWRNGQGESVLNDFNSELATTYRVVRDEVEGLIEALAEHYYDKDYYYEVRAWDTSRMSDVKRAARMIFLNRTGFNGLYRVNRSGRFNVPFGRYTDPLICDEENLRACSKRLGETELRNEDFEVALADADDGDFVYLDPPYAPVSRSSNFTAYVAGGFGTDQQDRLRLTLKALDHRKVRFMLSNSDAPGLAELYAADGWRVDRVMASRSVNSKASRRGKVGELVVRNY